MFYTHNFQASNEIQIKETKNLFLIKKIPHNNSIGVKDISNLKINYENLPFNVNDEKNINIFENSQLKNSEENGLKDKYLSENKDNTSIKYKDNKFYSTKNQNIDMNLTNNILNYEEKCENQGYNSTNTNLKFTKKEKKNNWTSEEDEKLLNLISIHGKKNWKEISAKFTNKSRKQCFLRWRKTLSNNNSNYGKYRISKANSEVFWTQNEDEIIIRWVKIMGINNWTKCSKLLLEKSPNDCKSRWFNKLSFENTDIDSDIWRKKDELILLLFIRKFGTCWSKLSKLFINKNANQIKNKFYSLLRFINKTQSSNQMNIENKNFQGANLSNNNLNQEKIKEKSEKIISYLIHSEDEFIKNQNIQIFKEAKRVFGEKVSHLIGKNDPIDNCLKNLNINNETLNLIGLENNKEAKIFNICSGCLALLKNHIKKRIMAKIKQNNLTNHQFINKILEQSLNRNQNTLNYNDDLKKNKIELNFEMDNKIIIGNESVKSYEILKNLPQLYQLINTIKEKIAN